MNFPTRYLLTANISTIGNSLLISITFDIMSSKNQYFNVANAAAVVALPEFILTKASAPISPTGSNVTFVPGLSLS